MDLRFESGRIAGARGWHEVDVIDAVAGLAQETPSSTPLLVEGASDILTVAHARMVAALHASGRPVTLVTDSPLAADMAQWIPDGCVHVIGAPLAPPAAAPANGTDKFFDPPDIESETALEWPASDLDSGQLMSVAGLLESTPVMLDTDREWWMRGSVCLHRRTNGWDARSDILEDVGFVALPLRIGHALVLGVGDIRGQYCNEGCYVVTGSWRRADDGSYGGVYTDGSHDVSTVSVNILLSDWSGDPTSQDTPDALPLAVRSTAHGEDIVLTVVEGMLLAITRGLLDHGARGFVAAIPQLQAELDEFRLAAAEYLRDYEQ